MTQRDGPTLGSLLKGDGFLRGYERAWFGAGNDVVDVVVYQFAGPRGADAYAEQALRASRRSDPHAKSFEVPRLPGVRGFASTNAAGTTARVIVDKGAFIIDVICGGKTSRTSVVHAITTTHVQYARL